MKRRELESIQVYSVHYSRLFLPPIKKISKPRHTSYSAHRRSISWRRPCFCRRSFLLLTDFSYFPSIYFAYTVQPARAVEGLLDLPNTTTITTRGSLGRIFILVSSPPAYTVGPAVCYKFMALLWAWTLSVILFWNKLLKSYDTAV